MSWNYPSTLDDATFLAILPDWAAGITQTTTYRTDISRSRRGLEQRTQRQRRPYLTMEYNWTATDAAARRRIENAVAQARGRLIVPWWPHGIKSNSAMLTDEAIILDSAPIEGEIVSGGWVYIWHRSLGGEFREVVNKADLTINLTSLPSVGFRLVIPKTTGAFILDGSILPDISGPTFFPVPGGVPGGWPAYSTNGSLTFSPTGLWAIVGYDQYFDGDGFFVLQHRIDGAIQAPIWSANYHLSPPPLDATGWDTPGPYDSGMPTGGASGNPVFVPSSEWRSGPLIAAGTVNSRPRYSSTGTAVIPVTGDWVMVNYTGSRWIATRHYNGTNGTSTVYQAAPGTETTPDLANWTGASVIPVSSNLVFPAGAFVFPTRAATRETADNVNQIARSRAVDETLTFRTL
jgi:hypothetical protein